MPQKTIKPIRRAKSLDRLNHIVGGLVGRKCWKVESSYGGEILLHFGKRIPCKHPKLANEDEGEWIFGTCGTGWRLYTPNGIVGVNGDPEQCATLAQQNLQCNKVTQFEASASPKIMFENDCWFLVIPTAADKKSSVPYWELFMPNRMFVAFGPGNEWSYRRSDLPEP